MMSNNNIDWTTAHPPPPPPPPPAPLRLLVILSVVRVLSGVHSIGRCDVSSVLVPDANVMGGSESTAGSNVTECEFRCTEMTSCLGFDWNRENRKCFLLTSDVDSINYNFSGVDHYSLLKDTNNCIGSCSYPRWVPIVNSHCFGGRPLDATVRLTDCARHCLQDTGYVAFDWDPGNTDRQRCWVITVPSSSSSSCDPLNSRAPGVFHYPKTCTPVSRTVGRTTASSTTTLPVTAAQVASSPTTTAIPSTDLTIHPTLASLPTTHPSSSVSTTTSTTSAATLLPTMFPESSSSTTTPITQLPSTRTETSTSTETSTRTTSASSKTTLPVGVSLASFPGTSTTNSTSAKTSTSTETSTSTTSATSKTTLPVVLLASTDTTHSSNTSTSTSATSASSKTTLLSGVSVASFSSTGTTNCTSTTNSTSTSTSTTSSKTTLPVGVSLTNDTNSTVSRGAEGGVTSSSSTGDAGATISAASVTSDAVRNTATNDSIDSNSTTPTPTTPTLTTPTLTAPTLTTPTLSTPTLTTPKEKADPAYALAEGEWGFERVDSPLAIKPVYIVLAGLGGGCLLLVLIAVVILCEYPLASEEDSVVGRGHTPYEINSSSSSNDIVDLDFFNVERNPEFRTSGVVAPEFEATSLN